MATGYIIAIAGVAATIIAALIGLLGKLIADRRKKNAQQITVELVPPPPPPVPKAPPHPDSPGHNYRRGEVADELLDYHGARDYFKQAAEEHAQVTGPASDERAYALLRASIKHGELAEYDEAIFCFREALAIYTKNPDKNQENIAAIYNNIALVYDKQDKLDEALKWYNKSLSIKEKELGKDHPNTAKTYNNIGAIYLKQGKLVEALTWYNKASMKRR